MAATKFSSKGRIEAQFRALISQIWKLGFAVFVEYSTKTGKIFLKVRFRVLVRVRWGISILIQTPKNLKSRIDQKLQVHRDICTPLSLSSLVERFVIDLSAHWIVVIATLNKKDWSVSLQKQMANYSALSEYRRLRHKSYLYFVQLSQISNKQ